LTAFGVEAIVSRLSDSRGIEATIARLFLVPPGLAPSPTSAREDKEPNPREDPMADMIISKSKTKESVKDCNVSGEFYEALDLKVRELIKAAEKRALENGRKTVRPYDL
jgi:hypothetical protein